MSGAPPEALKVILLWEYPAPSITVVPPDPLYSNGINQASVEFLIFNHLFLQGGLRDGAPYHLICDPGQYERMRDLVEDILRGPSDEAMAALRTPANHRKQLRTEMDAISGPVARLPVERMARVWAFESGRVCLPDGVVVEQVREDEIRVTVGTETVLLPRRAQRRSALPLYFADVDEPVSGPRLGLQVIGSASGFTGSEWSSAFIVWINGLPLIVDGTPYLEEHLARLGIEDEQILGYLITHVHEDHANVVGQLVNRRRVRVLTSPPIMASLTTRLAAILGIDRSEIRRLIEWIPLHPGLERPAGALEWYGCTIRTWYSVHTIPTLGVELELEGRKIRLPGDTIWGSQLLPFQERRVLTPERAEFVQSTYQGADLVVADAGGGMIHPIPEEVHALAQHHPSQQTLVTHIPEAARCYLTPAEPGQRINLVNRNGRTPEQATSLLASPILRDVPERWLLALLNGGEVVDPPEVSIPAPEGGVFVLAGSVAVRVGADEVFRLQRGDLLHRALLDSDAPVELRSTATWTRLLHLPEELYQSFVRDTGLQGRLERVFRTRKWWSRIIGGEPTLETLVSLAQLCRERSFRSGSEIVRQGDRATHFYVVTDGEVEVLRADQDSQVRLGRFGPGFFFGEIALLGEERRTATVRATTPVRVLELPARAFTRNLMEVPYARFLVRSSAEQRRRELRSAQAGQPARDRHPE